VAIANFSFQPATITVPVGTTVTWTNNDSASHTVTADDGSFKSESLGSGATFSQTFATAGTFAYHCAIHSTMKGTVVVK
jgi:plastocyanin